MRFPFALLGCLGLLVVDVSANDDQQQSPLSPAAARSVSLALFQDLEESARIVDISYCVGLVSSGISKPFQCLSRCSEFPHFELVNTWNTGPLLSDSCGYVALDHGRQRLLVAFRGTYSIANTLVDLSTIPQAYAPYPGADGDGDDEIAHAHEAAGNIVSSIHDFFEQDAPVRERTEPKCLNCTVHLGFQTSWHNTRNAILSNLQRQIDLYPRYKLHLVGHSLGGAVAALAGLECQARGWNPTVTTFGEPRIGNDRLARYLDERFELQRDMGSLLDDTTSRYRRVTHIDDPIPLLPLTEWGYAMHGGEIHISKPSLAPEPVDLHHCRGDDDQSCIAGQDTSVLGSHKAVLAPGKNNLLSLIKNEVQDVIHEPWGVPSRYKLWQLFFAHRDYFWRLGLCVPGGDPLGGGGDSQEQRKEGGADFHWKHPGWKGETRDSWTRRPLRCGLNLRRPNQQPTATPPRVVCLPLPSTALVMNNQQCNNPSSRRYVLCTVYLQNFNASTPSHPPLPPSSRQQETRPPRTGPPAAATGSQSSKKRRGPVPRSQANRSQPSARNAANSHPRSPDNGPGAPPPEPNTPDNIEEELIHALQGDGVNPDHGINRDEDDDDDDQDHDGDRDENEPVFQLPPPPEGNYADEKELEQQMHAWTLDHGYECVRRASKKNARGVVYKRYYHCSRHGKKSGNAGPDDSARKRAKKKTGRLGCPMSFAAVAVDPTNPGGEWQIRHRKTYHNHAAEDAVTLTGHRRRARGGDVERIIDSLFTIGTPTTQVLRFLEKNHPGGLFTRTDVANMKLKFNKYGTCVKDGIPERTVTAGKGGVPSACQRCRQKRVKCNSVRPTCGTCLNDGEACEYDHEPVDFSANNGIPTQLTPDMNGLASLGSIQQMPQSAEQQPEPVQPRPGRQLPRSEEDFERAQRIMSEFQSFQADHVRPTRLALESSVVELLATSSCGNGDLYKAVPMLTSASEWPAYSSSMIEASMKENTYDVLSGIKTEPIVPPNDCEVETWNEYIKQFAIFSRRNDMLLASIWGSLTPTFKTRVAKCKSAAQAWNLVEDMCQPHGSDQAFKMYTELHNVTLQTSRDLHDYVQRLEQAYVDLAHLKMSHQQAQDSIGISSSLSINGRLSSHTSLTSTLATSSAAHAKRNARTLGDATANASIGRTTTRASTATTRTTTTTV
nr:lipase a [Quercus suber]